MAENSVPLLDELRPLVADISKKVLDQIAPDETPMIDIFMESYYEPLKASVDLESGVRGEDIPLGIGSPDIMAALVIPLILSILIELVKSGKDELISALKKRIEHKKKHSKQTTFEINQKMEQVGKNYEIEIRLLVGNPKLAKKIMSVVDAVLKSELSA